MITPRTTRLLRVPGLRALHRTIALAAHSPIPGSDAPQARDVPPTPHAPRALDAIRDTLIVVSSSGAADQLRQTLEELWLVERWRPSADERAALGLTSDDDAGQAREPRDGTHATSASGARASSAAGEPSDAITPLATPTDTFASIGACVWPSIVTRGGLYRSLYERLDEAPALLDDFAREVLLQRAAADAVARGDAPPFEVRPGLVPEMLGLYDALRRQHRTIDDFERLVGGALEAGAEIDRGARRLLQQTRFLVSAFRAYEARLAAGDAPDEHGLRARLLERASARPIRRVIVAVPDQRADASGLWPADFDLLTRIPGLAAIDLVSTEALLGTGYIERLFDTLPGIEVHAVPDVEAPSPLLLSPPPDGRQDPLHFTSRDREQELADAARRFIRAATAAPASGVSTFGVAASAVSESDVSERDVSESSASERNVAGRDVSESPPPSASSPASAPPSSREAGSSSCDAGSRPPLSFDRMAVVYQRPLPYLYLARQVFGAHDLPWQAFDALPLAAEPYAAALDLVLTFALSGCTRAAGIALLRAPQFRFEVDGREPTLEEIAACDAALRDVGFLGGRDRLHALLDAWRDDATGAFATASSTATATPSASASGAHASRARALPALGALVMAADALQPLDDPALPSSHLTVLQQFLDTYERAPRAPTCPAAAVPAAEALQMPSALPASSSSDEASETWEAWEALAARHRRTRAAVVGTITGLRLAFVEHGESEGPFRDLAALVHRWLEGQTFNPRVGERGLHLVDVQAAMFGRFSHVALVGVVESEWPSSSSRSIFYPASLLRDLGWPAETERRAAARAVFDDLLRLARDEVCVSVFSLEHDAIVRPSPFVEDLASAGLRTAQVRDEAAPAPLPVRASSAASSALDDRLLTVPALMIEPAEEAAWGRLRSTRSAIAGREFHGWTGATPPRTYSVTGLDRYLQCPFRYFAAHVLRLDEEPDRRPGLTPLERGRFEHEVFQLFFTRWDAAGRGAIDEFALEAARAEFLAVVDDVLAKLPASERELERARLLGSAVSAGLGERVFRFEAARLSPIVERLLEYSLDGEYELTVPVSGDEPDAKPDTKPDTRPDTKTDADTKTEAETETTRTRTIRLRGIADRIDLLGDGTVRVIDYKTGKASSAASSIQLPVYAHCTEERLDGHRGRRWRVSEAGYLAFGRPEPFVPVVAAGDDARKKVTQAVAKVVEVVDRIEEGAFPVTPAEPHNCIFCGFSAVCRKDYVEDV